MSTSGYKEPFFRLSACIIAVLGTLFLVPTSWIAFGYALIGVAAAFADFFSGRFSTGFLRLEGAALFAVAECLALYLCYGFFRFAFQKSQGWRSRFLWAAACALGGVSAVTIIIFGTVFHDSYAFREAVGPSVFALFTGACWLLSNRT